MTAERDLLARVDELTDRVGQLERALVALTAASPERRVRSELTYSVLEAAQALGISDDALFALIKAGSFPTLRIGRRVLVSKAALAAWVEENGG